MEAILLNKLSELDKKISEVHDMVHALDIPVSNISQMAKILGMGRATVYRMMDRGQLRPVMKFSELIALKNKRAKTKNRSGSNPKPLRQAEFA